MHFSTALHVLLGTVSTVCAIPTSFSSTTNDVPIRDTIVRRELSPARDPSWKAVRDLVPTAGQSLPQAKTNGNSLLGTFDAKRYKQFKGQKQWGEAKYYPWGNKTAKNTDYYHEAPDTGVTQSYVFTIERAVLAPDGVYRPMILVNGAFPGPTIEANWGDTIEVTVHNNIAAPEEGTSLHWHGMLQKGTPWEDGVPGITQCPIAPGTSHTYSFRAELYGTSWWHAHFSSQYSNGLYGAMIIHGPDQDEIDYDDDLGPVLIADHFHRDYFELTKDVMSTDRSKILVKSANNLINGKGIVACGDSGYKPIPGVNATNIPSNLTNNGACVPNAGLSKFNFTAGQTYRLRLINSGVEGLQKFSIDDHEMTVIAYDFVPIKPHTTRIVTLGVGQRADVLVKANQDPTRAYWMRSTMAKDCSLTTQPNALAMIYYDRADTNSIPTTKAVIDNTDQCTNDDLGTMVPYYPIAPPLSPAAARTMEVNFTTNATGHFVWTVDNSSFRTNFNRPVLHELLNPSTDISALPREWNMYDFGDAPSIRITINNLTPVSHPMHLHGHNMFVLSSTRTRPLSPTIINPTNPARRDVQILAPQGQIVIQIDADNPGVWPLHCHVAWHVAGGLYMNIVEQPDVMANTLTLPENKKQLCRNWEAWTAKNVVNQIDSGLKIRSSDDDGLLSILWRKFRAWVKV